MKALLLCDDGKLQQVLPLCRQNDLGLEMQAFYNPLAYQNDDTLLADHTAKTRGISLKAVHGCFGDLCPGSFDPLVRSVTRDRFDLSYRAAVALKAQHLILHNGYVPNTSPPDRWLGRSVAFWKEYLAGKDLSLTIHVENVLESEPQMLADLIDATESPLVDANLDIGHAHGLSRTTVLQWIATLGKRIGYVHLHDNHGTKDEHLTLGKGTIPIDEVLSALEQEAQNAYWAIESEVEDIGQSIERVRQWMARTKTAQV